MIHNILADPQVHDALKNLASAAAVAIGALIGRLVMIGCNLLTAKIHAEHNALYAAVADRLVRYAEQKLASATNEIKAGYVAAQLQSKFPQLNGLEVQHLIEEAVVNMQIAMAEPQVNMNMQVTTPPADPAKGGIQQ